MLSSSEMSSGVKVTMEKSSRSCTTASFKRRKWGAVCRGQGRAGKAGRFSQAYLCSRAGAASTCRSCSPACPARAASPAGLGSGRSPARPATVGWPLNHLIRPWHGASYSPNATTRTSSTASPNLSPQPPAHLVLDEVHLGEDVHVGQLQLNHGAQRAQRARHKLGHLRDELRVQAVHLQTQDHPTRLLSSAGLGTQRRTKRASSATKPHI
jgi:hypothetical protein